MRNRYTPSQGSESVDWKEQIDDLTLKLLRSAERILDEPAIALLSSKYHSGHSPASSLHFIHYLVSYLVDQLHALLLAKIDHQPHTTDLSDYQVLQEAVQKAEAEIRKHIRIEQQCKIFIDSLEEKAALLKEQLLEEESKVLKLLEVIRTLEAENRRLGGSSALPHQTHTKAAASEALHRQVFVSWKSKRSKGKANEQLKNKPANQSTDHKLGIIESVDEIRLASRPFSRFDNPTANADPSLKELIKTVQMKPPGRASRNGKNRTELSSHNLMRLQRSSSMCG